MNKNITCFNNEINSYSANTKMKTIILIAILAITQALRCPICDSGVINCPAIQKLKCKGGLVADVCGCCGVCAKVKGEKCGGPFNLFGNCDCGLECLKNQTDILIKGRFTALGLCMTKFVLSAKDSKSSTKSPANPSPSQRPRVQSSSSTIALEPTFASPSTGSTTSSTVLEPVSVASTTAAPDAGTISPQLLEQIVSSQRPHMQTRSSTIALEPTFSSLSTGSTTSSTVLETVSVASTQAAPDAGTTSPQILEQIVSSQRPRVQTRSSTITLEPTIASPSTGSTSSTVLETVSVVSTSAASNAVTISPQLLEQIVSTVTLHYITYLIVFPE